MEARISSANQNQTSSSLHDSISLILFDDKVIVPFKNRNLTEPKDLLDEMLKHKTGGGTSFDLAIQQAGLLITTCFDPTK